MKLRIRIKYKPAESNFSKFKTIDIELPDKSEILKTEVTHA